MLEVPALPRLGLPLGALKLTAAPLRILHVAEPTDYGVARCVADLAGHQVQRGWAVTVLAPTTGVLAEAVTGAGAEHVPWGDGRSAVAAARDLSSVRAVVRATRPDVVHLHSSKAGALGRLAIRGSVPTVFQPHAWSFFALDGAARRTMVTFERAAARWADVVVCCSTDERDVARRAGIRSRFDVVPNAVDLTRFQVADVDEAAAARRRLGLPEGDPVAVCVGRLSPQKGQRHLLAVWRSVVGLVPEATLVLVGDGPDRMRLESLGVPNVRFVGHQPDVRPWLAAADVFVMLSRYEGMSLAVIEAMATGRSVVASAVTGMHETVGDGPTAAGAVVPPGDAPAAVSALVDRLRDPGLRQAEGLAGRRRAEAHHGRSRWLERVASLSVEVADRGKAGPCAS